MFHFKPEGMLLDTAANRQSFKSLATLQEAQLTGKILESRAVVCDSEHNLIVDMAAIGGSFRGRRVRLGSPKGQPVISRSSLG